ncbi:MAG: GAF domain-containing protein [Lachnospiraceae bacterium]|nr:GAF domain-containing protein [Lachnospiraceae bacterium]MBR7076648.1 GAF domain-containing protein [Lachnospiraceae bacterium]
MKTENLERFLNICIAITAEKDREKLLSQILDTAMDLADCDAGTLYLLEEDGLHFCRMVTRSLGIRQGDPGNPVTFPPVPLEDSFICSYAAMHNKTIDIDDIRTNAEFDLTGSIQYDEMTGYKTRSMLVVPMTNDKGDVIGVMQLINALGENGTFSRDMELLVTALASQAAICITNQQYAARISDLLDSLVHALSKAIDERSPYTANHTRNMVTLAERFLDRVGEEKGPFRAQNRRAFLMSVWLHDVGKLAVPLEVMDKATRLGEHLEPLMERIRVMGLLDQIAMLEGRISQEDLSNRDAEREQLKEFVLKINGGGFLREEDRRRIEGLAERTFTDENGEMLPWITADELACLLIPKGTLTSEERSVIESHVSITGKILKDVDFPKEFCDVPVWASSHHEFINGEGYPAHAKGEELPAETRLLTILDVFEALTASDRPYKKPMPVERALAILDEMVQEGKLDGSMLTLFKESKAWEADQ